MEACCTEPNLRKKMFSYESLSNPVQDMMSAMFNVRPSTTKKFNWLRFDT